MSETHKEPEGRDIWGPGFQYTAKEFQELLEESRRTEHDPPSSALSEEQWEELDRVWQELDKGTWKGLRQSLLDEFGVDYRDCPVGIKDGDVLPTIQPPHPGHALKVPYRDEHGNLYVQPPSTDKDGQQHPAIPAVRSFVRGENGAWEPRWQTGYKLTEGPPYMPAGLSPPGQRANLALIVCLGESDAIWAVVAARDEDVNIDVLGVPESGTWQDSWVKCCRGFGMVYLAAGGENERITVCLQAAGVTTQVVPMMGKGKDLRDTFEHGGQLTWLLSAADERAASVVAPATQPGRDAGELCTPVSSPSVRRAPRGQA